MKTKEQKRHTEVFTGQARLSVMPIALYDGTNEEKAPSRFVD